jgi:hypothetical protein
MVVILIRASVAELVALIQVAAGVRVHILLIRDLCPAVLAAPVSLSFVIQQQHLLL